MLTINAHDESENYDYGITRAFLDDGRIVVIKTAGDMSRNGVNTWVSLLILTMQEWKSENPLAILHDLRHPNQGLTPFARERTADAVKARPENLTVYSAVLLPQTFMKRIIEMFIRTPIFQRDGHHVQVFSDKEQALEWLHQQVQD